MSVEPTWRPQVVKCIQCGRDKWARVNLAPGEPEPPCFDCLHPARTAETTPQDLAARLRESVHAAMGEAFPEDDEHDVPDYWAVDRLLAAMRARGITLAADDPARRSPGEPT